MSFNINTIRAIKGKQKKKEDNKMEITRKIREHTSRINRKMPATEPNASSEPSGHIR
ncbi:hypothetical protein COTS27_00703 [Spirochaetota bacterium]|nr:hypothetical protein COTS27_00703 [Spirochaetota bacterium]